MLCAGAKTGRVNNGMDNTLDPKLVADRIFLQHPDAKKQLDKIAIVTGCFENYEALKQHLSEVRYCLDKISAPSTYRVLEHNVQTNAQFDEIVGELGYDIFITLECFDQELRNIALNGKVGKKGRDSKEFLAMIENYARYLEANPALGKHIVKVTYLLGLDSLEVTEYFFQKLFEINKTLKHTTILPWLSIFTTYHKGMRAIQANNFGLPFLLEAMELTKQYFDSQLLIQESGSTADGYARGFY